MTNHGVYGKPMNMNIHSASCDSLSDEMLTLSYLHKLVYTFNIF